MKAVGQDFSEFMKEQRLYEKAQELASKKVAIARKTFSPELKHNLIKLEEIKELKRNWNGNNAKPLSKRLINKTKSLIINLERQPQIFPTANDSIQIEYDGNNNSYLELQITKKNNLSFFKVDENGKETEGIIPFSSFALNSLVEKFYE